MADHTFADVEIAIGVATRNRPDMLTKCLASFLAMKLPEGVAINYFIVENNDALTVSSIVDEFAKHLASPHSAKLLHEPELGIPFARNRALDEATERQCRWLIFVDDDETVDPLWLSSLLLGAETKNYDLAAGPVVPTRPEGELTAKQLSVFEYYVSGAQRRLAVRNKNFAAGEEGRIDLETNNWIGRISALQKAGLRFDETMRHTGGTDTDLSRRAKRIGLKLGWVSEAIVYEVVPHGRLTLNYVYQRSRSQTLTKYYLRYRKHGNRRLVLPFAMAFQKATIGVIRLSVGVITGSRMQVSGARTLGVAVGYFDGILGKSSDFYAQTDRH